MPQVSATRDSKTNHAVPLITSSRELSGRREAFDFDAEFTNWPLSKGKRAFDLLISASLLVALAPLMLLIGALIKLTSRGPVLFCRARIGRNGELFPMLKFRSMVDGCDGPKLTCKGDSRITFIGRILRKFKLDELPQIINVLQGHMSMVGPRPHLPEVFAFKPEYVSFLRLRPGVTGAATVRFHREEETLKPMPWEELREFYIDTILPEKVRMEIEYAQRASLWTDLRLVLATASRAFVPLYRKAAKIEKKLTLVSEPTAVGVADQPLAKSGTAEQGEEYAA